jgi:hypothetical protein
MEGIMEEYIQRFGLAEDYKATSEIGDWLHLFYGLSFLPPNEVSDSFAFDIMQTAPTNDECRRFADYFCSTYIDTNTFHPCLWSRIPSSARRTTNGAESFNRHFSDQFNSPHPTFYVFWDVVIKQQAVTYTIANSLTTIAPITSAEMSKQNFLQRQWQRYSSAAISRLQYQKSTGHRFAAVTE